MKKKCQMFPIVKIFEVITVDLNAQFQKSGNFLVLEILPMNSSTQKNKKAKRHQCLLQRIGDCSPPKHFIEILART